MTYSDWRVELSEKYKVFKGLYKIIKTPGVIKAAPKQKLKNTVGISYKNSMGTLDYRRSIFPDYKANRSNRFARIKATPSGDPMADLSQNIYKKEGKRSLERRLAAKEKIRQEWLKSNNLPPDSKAQPPHFNEGVASLALKGGGKLIPLLMTGIGAAGTIMQAKRSQDTKASRGRRSEKPKRKLSRMAQKQIEIENKRGENVTKYDPTKGMIKPKIGEVRKTEELIGKYKATNKVIKPKEGEVTKQRELLKNVEKNITKPKKGEKKGAKKTVKNFIKARKKEGETMYKLKQDDDIATKGPGDLIPAAKKSYLEKLRRNLRKPENQFHTEDAIPTNNASSGNIAGLPPDDPPVNKNKKKRYIYGGRGSRKMWMNNK